MLYSWLCIDPSEHHYATQTSKFKIFLNQASVMLNNVFKAFGRPFLFLTMFLFFFLLGIHRRFSHDKNKFVCKTSWLIMFEKGLCADHPHANVFRIALLPVNQKCMSVQRAGAISGSENKVKVRGVKSLHIKNQAKLSSFQVCFISTFSNSKSYNSNKIEV